MARRRVWIAPLTTEQHAVVEGATQSGDAWVVQRARLILAIAGGLTGQQAAALVGADTSVAYDLIHDWQARGLDVLRKRTKWSERTLAERFVSHIPAGLTDDECWPWQGAHNGDGYGTFNPGTGTRKAHQVAAELAGMVVPEGYELDHTCRNRACVNPRHLEAVTHRENCRRGVHWSRELDMCVHGHSYTPETVIVTAQGGRTCRICVSVEGRRHTRHCKGCARPRSRARFSSPSG